MTRKPSPAQLRALRHYLAGDGAGESWAHDLHFDRLSWYRHERTLDSLQRNGWVDSEGNITEVGRVMLEQNRANGGGGG